MTPIPVKICRITSAHINQLRLVEENCFNFNEVWSPEIYKKELENPVSYYIGAWVLQDSSSQSKDENNLEEYLMTDKTMAGYMGAWVLADELHIITIGVEPAFRNKGMGKLLVWKMLQDAAAKGCRWATLEVSVSNKPARKLYEGFGFKPIGVRKDYYGKGDDAVIMWTGNLTRNGYPELLNNIKNEWEKQLCLFLE